MKKFFYSKLFIGLLCFSLGYFTHILFSNAPASVGLHTQDERIPVDPTDLDQHKLIDAMSRMEREMVATSSAIHEMNDVKRREDDRFVYFDVPISGLNKEGELKVSVKDGMIIISENSPNSESERQFSIDSGLDETKADVQTLKDKISIKIPKLSEAK